jgi:hypothetical protein
MTTIQFDEMEREVDPARKAAERVAIAKDALAWVEAGALIPVKSTYVRPSPGVVFSNPYKQQLRDVNLGKCEVCARGALFLAKAVRFNNVLADWSYSTERVNRAALLEHFDDNQINLIEEYYEGFIRNGEAFSWARNFWTDNSHRMTLILQNIIDNNGTFVPEQLPRA